MIRRWCITVMSICASVIAMVIAAGCDRADRQSSGAPPAAPIVQVHTAGDVHQPLGVVRMSVDRSTMTTADRLRVTLVIETMQGIKHAEFDPPLPEPPSGRLGEWTVASIAVRDQPVSPTHRTTEHLIVLEPFLEGMKTIPSMRVRLTGDVGTAEVRTEPVGIEVASVLSDSDREAEQLALSPAPDSVALTLPAKSRSELQWPLIAGAAALSAVTIGLWARYVLRRRVTPIDPVAEVRARLAAIQARLNHAAAEPFSASATGLGEVAGGLGAAARKYLEHGLGVTAIGATTDELAERVVSEPRLTRHAEAVSAVLTVLRSLEQEAFAPTQPRAAVLAEHLSAIDRFVTDTAGLSKEHIQAAVALRRAA